MILKIYNFLRNVRNNLKLTRVRRVIEARSTVSGKTHTYSLGSRINLLNGARASNVILKDYAWMEGTINVSDNGKVILNEHSKLGPNSMIQCVNRVEIGAYSMTSDYVTICDNNSHPVNPMYRKYMRTTKRSDDSRKWRHSANAPIVIGENCWIGTHVRICKGVTIGDNSIVAACSVVTKDVPANSIVAGNPAKVVKTNIQDIPAPTSCIGYNNWFENQ